MPRLLEKLHTLWAALRLRLRGGALEIEWRERDGHILMTGPAVTVFEGELID